MKPKDPHDSETNNSCPSNCCQSGGRNKIISILIPVVILLVIAISLSLYKSDNKPISGEKSGGNSLVRSLPQNQVISESAQQTGKKIYLGLGSGDKYSLVDTQTGEIKELIPSGYAIVSLWENPIFPTFLILQKDNNLYSFNVASKEVKSIFGSSTGLLLANNERVRIYPSISEKDKFIILINKLDLSEVYEIDGSSPVIGSRTYSYDATNNLLTKITNNRDLDSQEVAVRYDSKNNRLFVWPYGPGVSSQLPFRTTDLGGKILKEVVMATAIRDKADELKYNDGLFLIARGHYQDNRINQVIDDFVAVDAGLANPVKEEFNMTDQVKLQLPADLSIYSMAMDKASKTLIIGGSNGISLLRFDDNNRIVQIKTIPEPEINANFIFVENGKLHYKFRNVVKTVNLTTWEIEKSVPTTEEFEITLFSL